MVPDAPRPVPQPEKEERVKRAFRAWAQQNAFEHDERGYRGRILGRDVAVRHGLDGSSAVGAEAEITIEHDESAVFLFTPKRRSDPAAKSDVGEALVPLFDDPALGALRSIAVIKGGVRLGFNPLTEPDAIQAAVDGAIRAVEERLRARLRENAYR